MSATLSPAQRCAVAALARGETHESAAMEAGVHRQTVTRWLKIPAFADEVCRAREERLRAAQLSDVQTRLTTMALNVIEQALETGDVDAAFQWMRVVAPAGLTGASVAAADGPDAERPSEPRVGVLRSVFDVATAELCRECVLDGLNELLDDDGAVADPGAAMVAGRPDAGPGHCARCDTSLADHLSEAASVR